MKIIMNRVSHDLIDAIDVAHLAAAHDEDQCTVAIAMMTMALRHLVFVGGRDATAEMLHGVVASVGRGDYPEPTHAAGNG